MFVYALFDPRKPDVVSYVGLTENLAQRIGSHQAIRNQNTRDWIRELSKDGVPVGFKVLEETDDLNGISRERHWIAHFSASNPAIINKRCPSNLPFEFRVSPITTLRDMEGKYIRWTVDYFGGNKLAAAKALGIGRQTLYNKLKSAEA